ncbi:bifunctional DNA primase/polymerase [Kocuria rhizophila]|uniref:bifunctional DNA primase/polymerase n=1 Tax=Kocuria rhizophila TaxID=72000 RepID=UPI001ADB1F7F|nr:bifunctional DNA primase/polymerase [Kocuria rhizophila]QTK32340.1 bifunctional DNA primase/polymerase [Kocuria rhizophila]
MTVKKNPQAGDLGAPKNDLPNHHQSTRDHLYALAAHGFRVFPLVPGEKRPMVTGWEQKATTAPSLLDRWPAGAGVGIACGPSGLVVLDCDNHGGTTPKEWDRPGITNGLDVFADVWSRHTQAPLFDTMTVETPSGGLHFYYRAPLGSRIRNSAGKLGWQVDVRAAGGYVCAPGTTLPNGAYKPVGGPENIAHLPQWLRALLEPQKPTPAATQRRTPQVIPGPRSQVERRVRGLIRTVAEAPEGQRNSTLNWAAWQLAQDGLLAQEYAQALISAAETAGLPQTEAIRTVLSAAAPHSSQTQGAAA